MPRTLYHWHHEAPLLQLVKECEHIGEHRLLVAGKAGGHVAPDVGGAAPAVQQLPHSRPGAIEAHELFLLGLQKDHLALDTAPGGSLMARKHLVAGHDRTRSRWRTFFPRPGLRSGTPMAISLASASRQASRSGPSSSPCSISACAMQRLQ